MELNLEKNESTLEVKIEGRLDTSTAPILEKEMNTNLEGITNLILNLEGLDYISSAGLRVVLSLQKLMSKRGGMVIRHVNEVVMEVFDVTGFIDILTIEP